MPKRVPDRLSACGVGCTAWGVGFTISFTILLLFDCHGFTISFTILLLFDCHVSLVSGGSNCVFLTATIVSVSWLPDLRIHSSLGHKWRLVQILLPEAP